MKNKFPKGWKEQRLRRVRDHYESQTEEEAVAEDAVMDGDIREFTGEYYWLSNFWPAPIEYLDETWPSTEHLFQALKTTNHGEQEVVRLSPTPNKAKRAGRKVTLRPDWDEVKDGIMKRVLQLKFDQHPDLREKLLATGNARLFEGNWWGDRYWGVDKEGQGQNKLGLLLQEIRAAGLACNGDCISQDGSE